MRGPGRGGWVWRRGCRVRGRGLGIGESELGFVFSREGERGEKEVVRYRWVVYCLVWMWFHKG